MATANGPRRNLRYKPRLTDQQAYDLLPADIRQALREAVISFDALWFLNRLKKGTSASILVASIRRASREWAAKPLIPAKGIKGRAGYVPAVQSTYTELGVTPL